jgi:integrase/predicted RNA-binding Zn-ribbon protein involved in translation (DUF1610 family)
MAGLTQRTTATDRIFGKEAGLNGGKSECMGRSAGASPLCPQCGSANLWRSGFRYSILGEKIQRWLCRKCGFRFSDPEDVEASRIRFGALQRIQSKSLKAETDRSSDRQISAVEAKNLAGEQKNDIKVLRGKQDPKGKLVEFAWWMRQEGYAEETIRGASSCLNALVSRSADLGDPNSVKTVLALEQKWSQNRRRNVINTYTVFLKWSGGTWEKPKCAVTTRKFPFIPAEKEIDALIAGSGKKNAAFCQLLKETAIRSGEAKKLTWTDVDFDRNIITLNEPEKGSNPRMWKVSSQLVEMLKILPKKSKQIFTGSMRTMRTNLEGTRKRLAFNLQNPRLLTISFHTFRHWKATMLYHETKDVYYVSQFLGHKEIKNTMIYINIEHAIFGASSDNSEFTVRVTEKPEEIKALLEVGFEYVCSKDSLIFLRKRK